MKARVGDRAARGLRRVGTAQRIGIGLVSACLALLSAGCAAGQHAATAEESPALDAAVGTTVGDLELRAIAIEAPATGTSYPPGATAAITAVIVNTGHDDDQLTGVTSKAATGWTVFADEAAFAAATSSAAAAPASPAAGGATSGSPVSIPAGHSIGFGVPDSTEVLALTGLTDTLFTAQAVPLTFTFAHAGTVSVTVPVQLSTAPASSIVPSEPITPSETETATTAG